MFDYTDPYQMVRMHLLWPIVVGRMSAVLAFAFWVTLAFATTSATSMMLDALFAYALFGEIIAQEKRDDE